MPEEEQDILWKHTRIIREKRTTTKLLVEDKHHHHHHKSKGYELEVVRKERKRSKSPSLLRYLAGAK